MYRNPRLYSAALTAIFLFVGHECAVRAQTATSAEINLKQIEIREENGAAIVQITADGSLTVHPERLSSPERLVLDFSNARLGGLRPPAGSPVGPVLDVRMSQFRPGVARIVLDLKTAVPFHVESGDASVLVVLGSHEAPAAQATNPPQERAQAAPGAALTGNLVPARTIRTSRSPNFPLSSEIRPLPSAAAATPPAVIPAASSTSRPPAVPIVTAPPPNSFRNGLLTFHTKDRPLDLVLDDLGALTNVPIVLGEGVTTDQVSAEFINYRLDEALRQILKSYDVLFSYASGGSEGEAPVLRTVWVYPPNRGPGMARFAQQAWNKTTRQYEQSMKDSDPDTRSRAVDELIRRDGRGAVSVVMEALKDPSDKVRYQALYRAVLVGALPPEDTVIDLVLNDPSEQVRVWAFQTLPVDPTLRWVALRASNDSNQQVAEMARNYLRDLDASMGGSDPGVAAPPPTPAPPANPAPEPAQRPLERHPVAQPTQ